MSLHPAMQSRTSNNGFGRRRGDRETGSRYDSKSLSGRSSSGSFSNSGLVNGSKVGELESRPHDRLIFLTTSLIGQPVEVQVKNGSLFSGIFHAINNEREFGIILKMARLVKDGSIRGPKPVSEFVSKSPSKTLVIPAKELVQIVAKDVLLPGEGLLDGNARDKQQDIMLDSFISQSHHIEERELERWVPDNDDPQCPELENIFDGTWNRNWDQFETNEALFGVKSTFNEELYTTKLQRGPQMMELEREALRIAREIEGEETNDIHSAEERGLHAYDDFDLDEEARFSSVFRGVDTGRSEESKDAIVDSRNMEGFGCSSSSVVDKTFSDVIQRRSSDAAQVSPRCSSVDEVPNSQINASSDQCSSGAVDQNQTVPDSLSKNSADSQNRLSETKYGGSTKDSLERKCMSGVAASSKTEDVEQTSNLKKESLDKASLSPTAATCAPPSKAKDQEQRGGASETLEACGSTKSVVQSISHRGRPSSSSSTEGLGAASASAGPGLSPSSSVGSLSSEKSTLNPNAKEFKLNPNAKSFVPSSAASRPPTPGHEGSFYYPANLAAVSHMHGLPMGIGVGPSFGGSQPVIYSPPAAPLQAHQGYVHPSGPLYGQQMFVSQPRQLLYMQAYPPEMQYKGRDF